MIKVIAFPFAPVAAPRMTQRDKWRTDPYHPDPNRRQRKCVTQYFAFKNAILQYAQNQNFTLPQELTILFYVEMPKSWSKKKKQEMWYAPHQSRPDIDNYIKAFLDAFKVDDGYVWHVDARKIWAHSTQIEVTLNIP